MNNATVETDFKGLGNKPTTNSCLITGGDRASFGSDLIVVVV